MSISKSALVTQNKRRIAKQFSRAALHYDALANVQLDIALDAQAMLPKHSARLLDIGCGTGRITQRLSEQSGQLLAMDLAFGMLQQAKVNHMLTPIIWLQGDAEHLPFKSSSVDTVFSSMALQWCSHPKLVMNELHRILAPKGHAVLAIMTDGSLTELTQSWRNIDASRHVNKFYESHTWLKSAINSGFNVDCIT